MDSFFEYIKDEILLIHNFSSLLVFGSLVMIYFLFVPIFKSLKSKEEAIEKNLIFLKRYRFYVLFLLSVILISGFILGFTSAIDIVDASAYIAIQIEKALWGFIAFNFIYTEFKYQNAQKAFKSQEIIEVEENLILIYRYFLPLNLVLTFVASYFALSFRIY